MTIINVGLHASPRYRAAPFEKIVSTLAQCADGPDGFAVVQRAGFEPTVVLRVRPLASVPLARDLGQECIAVLGPNGTLGLSGDYSHLWGPADPAKFLMLDGRTLAEHRQQVRAESKARVSSYFDRAADAADALDGPLETSEDDASPYHAEALNREQSRAVAGGLQQHSVGGRYPVTLVGYEHPGRGTMYYLQNLQTGKVPVTMGGMGMPSAESPRRARAWARPDMALAWLDGTPRAGQGRWELIER